MKHRLFLLAICAICAIPTTFAATLPKHQVASDAKWLLHLDLQNLWRTQVGEFLTKNLLEKASGEVKDKIGIDVSALVQKISHITAYGTEFAENPERNSVLMVQIDAEARKILEGFLAAQLLADSGGKVTKEQQGASALYSLHNELFLSLEPNHVAILGKSAQQIDKAKSVLAGKSPSLKGSDAFSDFPPAPDAFFFLAVAEGFNADAAVPPQAQVLKMADGGQLVLGEQSEKLFLSLALKSKTAEVTEQIQQVFEGIRAMVMLGQTDNKDLQELVRSIKVVAKNRIVTVNAEFPVAPLLKKVGDKGYLKLPGQEDRKKEKQDAEK
jgi:hypothetical protein